MKPHLLLAESTTPDGAKLTLNEHDGSFCIRINGQQLMHSAVNASEQKLGELGCERHARKPTAPRVLIGGLGLGFTLKSVLAAVGSRASIQVAELFPDVVKWNRTFMAGLNGKLLDDPRVTVLTENVRSVIRRSDRKPFDVILLDIDNGATAMSKGDNNELYSPLGLFQLARALKPDGRVALWSASPDATIAARLGKAGFTVQAVATRPYPTAKRSSHVIYVADRVVKVDDR